jgi:hypothetical protein
VRNRSGGTVYETLKWLETWLDGVRLREHIVGVAGANTHDADGSARSWLRGESRRCCASYIAANSIDFQRSDLGHHLHGIKVTTHHSRYNLPNHRKAAAEN